MGKAEGRRPTGETFVERIALKWILKIHKSKEWNGLVCHRAVANGGGGAIVKFPVPIKFGKSSTF
jgi:hypothetical protein